MHLDSSRTGHERRRYRRAAPPRHRHAGRRARRPLATLTCQTVGVVGYVAAHARRPPHPHRLRRRARRAGPPGRRVVLAELERVRELDERHATRGRPSATTSGPGSRPSRRRSVRCGATARPTRPRRSRPRAASSGSSEKELDAEADRLAAEVRDLLLRIPNIPADDAPDGAAEADNRCSRSSAI